MSSTLEQALTLCKLLDDHKAKDLMLLDVSHLTVITEYFILATGRSALQVRSLCDNLEEKAEELLGLKPHRRDGTKDARWIVLDYGSIIVHVFHEQEREFYNLERLWMDGSNRVALDFLQEEPEMAPETP